MLTRASTPRPHGLRLPARRLRLRLCGLPLVAVRRVGWLEVLQLVRLQRAPTLLRGESCTVFNIASMCGSTALALIGWLTSQVKSHWGAVRAAGGSGDGSGGGNEGGGAYLSAEACGEQAVYQRFPVRLSTLISA